MIDTEDDITAFLLLWSLHEKVARMRCHEAAMLAISISSIVTRTTSTPHLIRLSFVAYHLSMKCLLEFSISLTRFLSVY